MTCNKTVTAIIVSSALLMQLPLHASEKKTPDTQAAYCPDKDCWQKVPCPVKPQADSDRFQQQWRNTLNTLATLKKQPDITVSEIRKEKGRALTRWETSITFPSYSRYEEYRPSLSEAALFACRSSDTKATPYPVALTLLIADANNPVIQEARRNKEMHDL